MTRWFRLYDDVINDPKIMCLSEEMRWHWVALLCVASKGKGWIESVTDLAFMLRVTEAKANEIVTVLVTAGLLERYGERYAPHNWDKRQYKCDVTDPTAKIRMKRYRERKRNVTVELRPEQNRTEQNTTVYEDRRGSLATAPNGGALRSPLKKLSDIPAASSELAASFVKKGALQ